MRVLKGAAAGGGRAGVVAGAGADGVVPGRTQQSHPDLAEAAVLRFVGGGVAEDVLVADIQGDAVGDLVDLAGVAGSDVIGYRAKTNAPLVDLSKVNYYDPTEFWDPITRPSARQLILNPEDFYLLLSKERVRIPPDHAAEMVAYDPSVGEFRIHYAGFFDPGFGYGADDILGTHAVLEVRSHEVPFVLDDGQTVARLLFEQLLAIPDKIYGLGIGSTYQQQGLSLSKQFKRGNG